MGADFPRFFEHSRSLFSVIEFVLCGTFCFLNLRICFMRLESIMSAIFLASAICVVIWRGKFEKFSPSFLRIFRVVFSRRAKLWRIFVLCDIFILFLVYSFVTFHIKKIALASNFKSQMWILYVKIWYNEHIRCDMLYIHFS